MVGRSGARLGEDCRTHRRPAIDALVVEYNDLPIGYIQGWDSHAEADHPCRDQPVGTRGIDQFIGEPQLVGRGHGTAFIRLFVEILFGAGTPRVITDLNPRNSRAIRAYAKAGFKEIDRPMTISRRGRLDGPQRLAIQTVAGDQIR
jgi:aminoglycoside 6'-N-acetyltransferase